MDREGMKRGGGGMTDWRRWGEPETSKAEGEG